MTLDELAARLSELEETRREARTALDAAKERTGELEALERDKDTLLESYAAVSPEALDTLTPEERNHLYGILRLKAWLNPDKSIEIELAGAPLDAALSSSFVSNSETESECRSSHTHARRRPRPWRPSPDPPRRTAARR